MPTALKSQLEQKGVHSPHGVGGASLECSPRVIREAVPLDPTEYLLHKAALSSSEDTAALPTSQKQTLGSCQVRRQRNIKEQNKTPGKEVNKTQISDLLDAEFKTRIIRIFDELSENLNSMETIKKNQSEMKDALTEMENNLQGMNSRVDKAKNQIRDL